MMGQFFGGNGGGFNFGSFGGGAGGGGNSGGFNFGGSQPTSGSKKRSSGAWKRNQQQQSDYSTSRGNDGGSTNFSKEDKEPLVVKVDCTLEDLYKGTTKNMKVKNDIDGKTKSSEKDKKKKVSEKTFPVEVKAGYKKGTKVKFSASKDFPRKVVFEINEVPHKYFERIGDDLKWICKLSKKQVDKGVKVKVPLLDGETLVINTKEYPQIKDGARLPFPGKGMPSSKNPEKRGSLIIKFQISDGEL
jgi:DnaJ-class molecular chaperone